MSSGQGMGGQVIAGITDACVLPPPDTTPVLSIPGNALRRYLSLHNRSGKAFALLIVFRCPPESVRSGRFCEAEKDG